MSDETKRLLEALLFASAEPLSARELHERMPEGADVGGALLALQEDYAERGVTLVEMEGKWAFRTATDLAEMLQLDREEERKLSRAALETLAIVAYHQPVTRAEIENIRGVATHRGTLDILLEAGWIKTGRRRETPGRPVTWVTTTGFMDHFALESMTDLPGLDELKASGLLDRRPAIEAIPESQDLFASEGGDGVEEADETEDDFDDEFDEEFEREEA